MKVILDAYGGDNSPLAQIAGAILALSQNPELTVMLCGDSNGIENELSKHTFDKARIEIINASDVITNEESPTAAIRIKRDSSMVRALEYLNQDPDAAGLVSCGSTGALLAGATFITGRIKGVQRPCMLSTLPTVLDGRSVSIADTGANMDCRSQYLKQFALMGISYIRAVYNIANPVVGLLSVGSEEGKGNELTKETYGLLKDAGINFAGNVEARDILNGTYDLIVTDGFAGNVMLKSIEGMAKMMTGRFKRSLTSTALSKLGALLLKKQLYKMRSDMDYNTYGGAPFLGVNKPIIKSHGSANPKAVAVSISQIIKMHQGGMIQNLINDLCADNNNE